MKVLFTFGGLPHYNNYILSRLNLIENLEIVVAVPGKGAKTIGDSVKQTSDGINFKIIYLEERKAFYGNYYLHGLLDCVREEKPDIIVTIWPYILHYIIDFKLRKYLKKNKIKLIIKEIPFDIPPRARAISYYKSDYALRLNEDMEISARVNLFFYIKHFLLKWARVFYYSRLVDATVNYIDDAYEISTSYGLRKEQIFISTNSPDTDLIFDARERIKNKPSILEPNPHRIIHIGRLVKWKKTDQIIQALKILITDFPDIELVIVGTGKEEKNLQLLAKKLSVENHVKFVGGIYENEELGEYLLASSVYVLAGMGGLSINQAMAFGKPVICSIADGTEKRLVRDGYNGFYFQPDDIADLADKIKTLLQNPKMIEEFGDNSLQIIKNEVNVHTVIRGYVDAFNYVSTNEYLIY